MARFGRYNVTMNRRANPLQVIFQLVAGIITLFVGSKIINSIFISSAINNNPCYIADTGGMFYQAWSFLGITNTCVANGSTGILGVMGLIVFAVVVLNFVKINKM